MAHARSTIRQAIVDALKAAGTAAGTRVYTEERITALAATELPAIRVATLDEGVESAGGSGGRAARMQLRTLTLSLTYISKTPTGYVDAVDTACAQIEVALANLVSAAIKDLEIARTQLDLDDTADTPLYTAAITIAVTYYTQQGSPASTR